jgi:hypothetical protein
VEDDDPEKRISELERGISAQGYPPPLPPPPPPPNSWENYTPQQPSPWQSPRPVVVKGGGLRLIPIVAVALGVVVPLIIGIVVYFSVANPFGSGNPFGGSSPFSSTPELHTKDGLNGLMSSMRDHFGDTTGFELVVYPGYASLDRPSPTNKHAKQSFMYRGDGWNTWAPDSSIASFDHAADLSQFDAAGVSTAIANAAKNLEITDATATYLIIEGNESGGVDLTVHVSAPASGWIEIKPDGSTVKLHPPGS